METSDPAKAFAHRFRFLGEFDQAGDEGEDRRDEAESQIPELDCSPLGKVTEFYFDWKAAESSAAAIARERRFLNLFSTLAYGMPMAIHQIRKPIFISGAICCSKESGMKQSRNGRRRSTSTRTTSRRSQTLRAR